MEGLPQSTSVKYSQTSGNVRSSTVKWASYGAGFLSYASRFSPLSNEPTPGFLFVPAALTCCLRPFCDLQCCECLCIDGPGFECGSNGFYCQDPACFDPSFVAELPDCTGDWLLIGDGTCAPENNNAPCGYDGGDVSSLPSVLIEIFMLGSQ